MENITEQDMIYRPITSRISYLIGAPEETIDTVDFSEYHKTRNNRAVRNLMRIRTAIITDVQDVNTAYTNTPDLDNIDINNINLINAELKKDGVKIEQTEDLFDAIISINQWIYGLIGKVLVGFSNNVRKDWLREIFIMPTGHNAGGIRIAIRKFEDDRTFYPYDCYINWNYALTSDELKNCNILESDDIFLSALQERFAPIDNKEKVKEFFKKAQRTSIIVDCENADPLKTFSFIDENNTKDTFVYLIDDVNTTPLWQYFETVAKKKKINIVREKAERIKPEKSLVDMKMMARACEEVFVNKSDSVVIVSSDSDMWAIVSSLSSHFLIALEREKSGKPIFDTLAENSIPTAFLDTYNDNRDLLDYAMKISANEIMAHETVDVEDIIKKAAQQLKCFVQIEDRNRYKSEWLLNNRSVSNFEKGTVFVEFMPEKEEPVIDEVSATSDSENVDAEINDEIDTKVTQKSTTKTTTKKTTKKTTSKKSKG